MRVDLRSAIQWRARRVVPAVLNRWAQYQLRRHGALDTLYAFHASQYRGALAPEYADLWFLYHTVRIRKPLAVLEFGSGCSTVVMAQALTDNHYGQLYSVDADESWAQSTRQAIPSRLQARVQVSYSPLLEVQEKGILGFRHVKVPDVAPNLIYLDGPQLTAQRQVAFDVLDMEDRLPDDFMLIIDDRQENYAFLRRHLRYPYVVRRRFNGRFLKTETFERTRPPSI